MKPRGPNGLPPDEKRAWRQLVRESVNLHFRILRWIKEAHKREESK